MQFTNLKKNWVQKTTQTLVGLLLVSIFLSPMAGVAPQVQAQTTNDTATFTPTNTGRAVIPADTTTAQDPSKIDTSNGFDSSKNTPTAPSPIPAAAPAATNTGSPLAGDQTCSSGNFSSCLSNIVYIFTVGMMSIVAYIGSWIFDVGVVLTLQSVTYSQSFISLSWTAVRDLANMVFIFLIIYLAITIVLNVDTSNTYRKLAGIIICALLINFSFFITRSVIDAGNILATQFYNAIDAPTLAKTANDTYTSPLQSGANIQNYFQNNSGNTKDLTANIMNLIGVQRLLSDKSFSATFKASNTGVSGFIVNVLVFSFIYIAVGMILAMLAFTFIAVGFKFLIRIVVLWIVIIASPLAFLAKVLYKGSRDDSYGYFKQWSTALIEFSFYPAVFLFMFWIINFFAFQLSLCPGSTTQICGVTDSAFQGLQNATDSGSSFLVPIASAVGSISVRLGLIVILLYFAMKASSKVASTGNSVATGAAGWLGNKLSSSVAWGGRNTAGWAGYKFAQSNVGRSLGKNALTRPLVYGAQKMGSAKYDARGIRGVQSVIKGVTGVSLGKPSDRNYIKDRGAQIAAREAFSKTLKPDEAHLNDAYRTALGKLLEGDRKALETTAKAYQDAQDSFKNGEGSREDVNRARKAYREVLDRQTVKDAVSEAKKIAGVDNVKDYASNIDSRNLGNLGGLLSPGLPFFITSADKEAAAKIRGDAKGEADRIQNIIKALPPVPTIPNSNVVTASNSTAQTGAGGNLISSGSGNQRPAPSLSGPTAAPEGLQRGDTTILVPIDTARISDITSLDKKVSESAIKATQTNKQLMEEQIDTTKDAGEKIVRQMKDTGKKTTDSLGEIRQSLKDTRDHSVLETTEFNSHQIDQLRTNIGGERVANQPIPTQGNSLSSLPSNAPVQNLNTPQQNRPQTAAPNPVIPTYIPALRRPNPGSDTSSGNFPPLPPNKN